MAKGSQILTSLLFNIEANTSQLVQNLNKAQNRISNFGSAIGRIGGAIGIAFSIQQIGSFIGEVSKLAGEAAGVENAFKKIGGNVKLLQDLKAATKGTVSELNLMKRAVSFKNFGLEVQQLPKLLEFATKRAQQTGQSVDFLVDSIVTGLGRKSVLILDNLGISSSQLNAEIEKTGDFFGAVGTIVDQQLVEMGDLIETNVTKTERFNASWQNFKVFIGEAANETGLLGKALDTASGTLDLLASKNISTWEKAGGVLGAVLGNVSILGLLMKKDVAEGTKKAADELKKQEQVTREVDRAFKEFNGNIDAYGDAISTHIYKAELLEEFTRRLTAAEETKAKSIENIKNLTEQLTALQENQSLLTGKALVQTNKEIDLINEKIKALKELGKAEDPKEILKSLERVSKFQDRKFEGTSPIATTVDTTGMQGRIDDRIAQETEDRINRQEQGAIRLATAWENVGYSIKENLGNLGVSAIDSLGNSLGNLFVQQEAGFKGFIMIALDGIKQLLQAQLANAIMGLTAKEVSTKGIIGLAVATAGVAALYAVFNSLPAFEKGGIAPGGMALVGEAGAELVDLPKGSRVYNHNKTRQMLNGGGATINVTGVLRGEDIYISNKEVQRKRGIR